MHVFKRKFLSLAAVTAFIAVVIVAAAAGAGGISVVSAAEPPGPVDDAWPIHISASVNANDESVFNYRVILNGSPNAGTPLFDEGKPAIFTDAFDNGLEYLPGSLYVIYKPNDSDSGTWRYYTPSSGNDVGDDMCDTNTANTISADLSAMYRIDSWGGSVASSSGFAQPGSLSEGDIDYKYWYVSDSVIEIIYKLRIADRNAAASGSRFKNTATIISTSKEPGVPANDFSAVCEVVYTKSNPLRKTMVENGSNIVEFEIIINQNGRKLNDAPGADGRLAAADKMSPNLSFHLNSLKYYTMAKVGGVWTGEWVGQPGSATGVWSVSIAGPQDATFIIPDETPVRIVYSALVTRPVGELVTVENTTSIGGSYYAGSSRTFLLTKTDVYSADGDNSIHVFNTDSADASIRLDGAEFTLYMATPGGAPYDGVAREAAFEAGEWRFYDVMASSSGAGTGEYLFESRWLSPSIGAVYLIVETKAPDGYVLPEYPENQVFFVLNSPGEEEMAALNAALGVPVLFTADTIHIRNMKALQPQEEPQEEPQDEPQETNKEEARVIAPEITEQPKDAADPDPAGIVGLPQYTATLGNNEQTVKTELKKDGGETPEDGEMPEDDETADPEDPGQSLIMPENTNAALPETSIQLQSQDSQGVESELPETEADVFLQQSDTPGAAVPPETAEAAYIPGGIDKNSPPNPTVKGNTLIIDGDGWVELNTRGDAIGKWDWDYTEEMWVFDEYPPLAALPQTSGAGAINIVFAFIGAAFAGVGITLSLKNPDSRKRAK